MFQGRRLVLLSEPEKQLEGAHEAPRSVIHDGLGDDQLRDGFPHPLPDNQEQRSNDARELLLRLDELVEYLEQTPGDCLPPMPGEDPQSALRITPDI